jgi:CubicO group peptidase (beta-lactamase class C family)
MTYRRSLQSSQPMTMHKAVPNAQPRSPLGAVALAAVLTAVATAGLGGLPAAAYAKEASGNGATHAEFSAERLARIKPAMQQLIDQKVFPGAVTLVSHQGKVVHFESVGFLDDAKTKPIAKDSIFRLASMTKPIVTVAAMMLVEQGKLALHDPVSKWLPELKDLKVESPEGDVAPARPVLVHDLMRHTAGFVYGGAAKSPRIKELYQRGNIESAEQDITGDEMLKALGKIPLANQPGTTWLYSISVDVLGLLIERVEKKPLDRLLKDLLFDPLGMTDTAFWVPADKTSRIAEAYDADPLKADMLKAYRIAADPSGKSYFKGGAGLVGTAEDYLKFAQMMVNGGELNGKRFLSSKTVDFMLSDHTKGMGGSTIATTGPGYGFGLGFGVRLDQGMGYVPGTPGDAMWAGAWGTSFWIDPKERLVGILMAQSPSNRYQTRMVYKHLVYGALSD